MVSVIFTFKRVNKSQRKSKSSKDFSVALHELSFFSLLTETWLAILPLFKSYTINSCFVLQFDLLKKTIKSIDFTINWSGEHVFLYLFFPSSVSIRCYKPRLSLSFFVKYKNLLIEIYAHIKHKSYKLHRGLTYMSLTHFEQVNKIQEKHGYCFA